MQRPFFAPSRQQVSPDPSPLPSPRALRTGLLSGCSSPIIPLDAKARLLSVFLALRAVPKPACSSTHLTSQVLGQGSCWQLAFSEVKNHSVPSAQSTEVVSEGRISLGYSPHLMPFLNPGHHPVRVFLQIDPQVHGSPSSQSQHHPALCGTDPFFSAGVVLFCCLCWVFLRFPSLHPLPRALTFIVCLGKGLRHREELGLGMLPPATKEQSWIS